MFVEFWEQIIVLMSLQANLTLPAYGKSWNKLVACATSPRTPVLKSWIAPKSFDTNKYLLCWVAQSSKNYLKFFIHLSASSYTVQDCEFFTQWCSLQNLWVFIHLAEYHWSGLLRVVQCCFSGRQWLITLTSPTTYAGGKLPTSTGGSGEIGAIIGEINIF